MAHEGARQGGDGCVKEPLGALNGRLPSDLALGDVICSKFFWDGSSLNGFKSCHAGAEEVEN